MLTRGSVSRELYALGGRYYIDLCLPPELVEAWIEQGREGVLAFDVARLKVPFRYRKIMAKCHGGKTLCEYRLGDWMELEWKVGLDGCTVLLQEVWPL